MHRYSYRGWFSPVPLPEETKRRIDRIEESKEVKDGLHIITQLLLKIVNNGKN